MKPNLITLRVWGDFACFTRPEMKVERVSYPVMTPSAARGILEAIYWKPQIRWIINHITVINPIRFTNIRRNEIRVSWLADEGVPGKLTWKPDGQREEFVYEIPEPLVLEDLPIEDPAEDELAPAR